MNIFDAIKSDRESGTRGDLMTISDHDWSLDTGTDNTYYVIGTGPAYPLAVIAVESAWEFDAQIDADKRRFCRLPQLEAIALAAEGLAQHVEVVAEWMRANGHNDRPDIDALSAFREACK